MLDTPKHQGLRNQLVKTLIKKGIKDQNVLKAIGKIPRHLFMESAFEPHAYQDKAFPISAEQTISQPYTVAFQSQLLQVKKGDKILEVGTGSGYQAAVLLELGAKVYSVERIKELYVKAKDNLKKTGYRPKYMSYGDGYKGLERFAPYDGIIVTAAAPYIPEALVAQLKPGGKLVIPVGVNEQIMQCVSKDEKGEIRITDYGLFRFVPMLKDKE